jgi:hypothetical protein
VTEERKETGEEKKGKPKEDAKKDTIVSDGKKTEPVHKRVKLRVETDIDRLYELVRDKGIVKLAVAAKKLRIDEDRIEAWSRVLEEHKLIKLHYPPVGDPVMILKKFKTDVKELKERKGAKKLKFNRKVFFVNIAILLGFIIIVAFFTMGSSSLRVTYAQVYLAATVLIIIIVLVLFFKFRERWGEWLKLKGLPKLPKLERLRERKKPIKEEAKPKKRQKGKR